MTDHAAATLAALRATIRRLALPASFAQQPTPDWDALIAEQDAREAAPPTAATAMPARALRPLQAAHGFRAHIRW